MYTTPEEPVCHILVFKMPKNMPSGLLSNLA